MSEQALLGRLRRGDHGAFEQIFREHYRSLVGLGERMLRDRAVAEEVAQEVLAELWRRRERLEIEESLRAYLYRSTRNRVLNEIRHERVVQRSADHVRETMRRPPPASAGAREREIEEAVRDALELLPERCREVFELSRGHGLTYAEIATTMEISVKTVEAQMGKALKLMRNALKPWLE